MIRPLCLWIVALTMAVGAAGQSDSAADPWALLRPFEGKWEGSISGKPGQGSTFREFRFELNGRFLSQRDRATYEPSAVREKPEVHEDFGFFSYDRNLRKLVWRQFHSEGFVHEYTLESASPDGKRLDFISVRIENIAPGWRAKESLRMLSADAMEATFLLAAPGKDFEVYTLARLKRAK
jgi:hypothetical protein